MVSARLAQYLATRYIFGTPGWTHGANAKKQNAASRANFETGAKFQPKPFKFWRCILNSQTT